MAAGSELFRAARAGDLATVKKLVSSTASKVHSEEGDRCTLLHVATTVPLVEFLFDRGLNVNARTSASRETPLHHAAHRGDLEVTTYLLDHGADIHAADCVGAQPLHHACSAGHHALVEILLSRGADAAHLDQSSKSTLHWACRSGSVPVVKALIAHGCPIDSIDYDADTALHVLCRTTAISDEIRAQTALALLDAKPSIINAKNLQSRTALSYCVAHSLSTTRLLIDRGASPCLLDPLGRSPLHWACQSVYALPDTVRALIAAGAPLDLADRACRTPLHYAVKANPDLVSVLLEAKAPVQGPDPTPLSIAVSCVKPSTIAQLIAAGAKPSPADVRVLIESGDNINLDCLRLLLAAGALVGNNTSNADPMVSAAMKQRNDIMKLLVTYGGRVGERTMGYLLRFQKDYYEQVELMLELGGQPSLGGMCELPNFHYCDKSIALMLPFTRDLHDTKAMLALLQTWIALVHTNQYVAPLISSVLLLAPLEVLQDPMVTKFLLKKDEASPAEVLAKARMNAVNTVCLKRIP